MLVGRIKNMHYKELFLYGSLIGYIVGMILTIILSTYTHNTFTIIAACIGGSFIGLVLWHYVHYKKYLLTVQLVLWTFVVSIYTRIIVYDYRIDIAYLFLPPMVATILLDTKNLIIYSTLYILFSVILLWYGYDTYPNHPFLHNISFILTFIVISFFVIAFWAIYHYSIEQSYKRLEESEKQKTFLLKEIHHRVKNNLNMMTSILGLQEDSYQSADMQLFIKQNTLRINSIALVHELLYQNENLEYIDLQKYINNLTNHILSIYRKKDIKVKLDVEKMQLNINIIIHLGIILNELITNSVKYAFVNKPGQITISLVSKNSSYILKYDDNGIGIEKDKQYYHGFGLNLIHLSVEQLKGNFHILDNSENKGFSCYLQFKGTTR